jgi:hypothetical protein
MCQETAGDHSQVTRAALNEVEEAHVVSMLQAHVYFCLTAYT